jgi:hypothetical protein
LLHQMHPGVAGIHTASNFDFSILQVHAKCCYTK